MNLNALLITLASGIAFLIGWLITKLFTNKKKLVIFSIGFGFSVLIGLILFDLLPECFELFSEWYVVVLYIIIGILLLKAFDILIPHHEHTGKHSHIEHISLMSFVAILLHNIIETTAIYTTSVSNLKMGLLMSIGVSCHNIPFGIQMTSLSKSNKQGLLLTSLLAISSIIGILVFNVFNIPLTDDVLGMLISITLGMLIYIVFFELLCEVKEHIKTKEMFYGLFFGVFIVFIASLF